MTATTFAWEALDAAGAVVRGKTEGDSADKVAQSLQNQQLIPMSVAPTGRGLSRDLKLPGRGGRTTPKDLAVFTRQFASMSASGLTLLRALAILEDQTVKPKLREAIRAVRVAIQGGATLSSALAQHPATFPSLMVDMVRAGETGGFLDQSLARLATMYESDVQLRATIKAALTYPVIVLIFSLTMGVGVVIFIVPIFERMFANLGGKLPLPTQIIVNVSHNMAWLGPLLLVAALAALHAYRRGVQRSPEFRLRKDRIVLRLPVVGALAGKLAISRWARNLGTLISVGVPLLQSLEIVGGTSGNAVVGEAMKDVRAAVRDGQRMSGPLNRHPLFPTMVTQMLEVGEETGQMSEMLDKTADYYEREVETATEALTSALEPLMVVVMGLVIGTMVICLYLPMFSIYQNIQNT